jgi:hypothetical protein
MGELLRHPKDKGAARNNSATKRPITAPLQKLRTQLQNAGGRIQRDIAQYTELSQQTMQLTAIISDSVKKLPTGASNLLH